MTAKRLGSVCVAGSLALAVGARGDFTGLGATSTTETTSMGTDIDVFRLYATFDDPNDAALAAGGTPSNPCILDAGPGGFFQVTAFGSSFDIPVEAAALGFQPDLAFDSFLSIGVQQGYVGSPMLPAIAFFNVTDFNGGAASVITTNGGWFAAPGSPETVAAPLPAGDPGSDQSWMPAGATHAVLLGQFTVTAGNTFAGDAGTINVWENGQPRTITADDPPGANTIFDFRRTIEADPRDRVNATEKGSLLVFPAVELRWTDAGALRQDTFLTLVNDYGGAVDVQLFFVNGDPPLDAAPPERAHPGWNWQSATIHLQANQKTWFSLLQGLPGSGGVPPFPTLDPGFPPGRPSDAGNVGDDRVLRGHVYAWAVNADGVEIAWNHLSGKATTVDYADGAAREHGAFAYRAPGVSIGSPTGTPGVLMLDGLEYDGSFDELILEFQASGSTAFSGPRAITAETDLALQTVARDLRLGAGAPTATRASFTVWNMNAVKLSGAGRCVTGWDRTLLSEYDAPNHFLRSSLQTDLGGARIRGEPAPACDVDFDPGDGLALGEDPRDVVSIAAPLLGVAGRWLSFDADDASGSAVPLRGTGLDRSAAIRFDVFGQPPEATAAPTTPAPAGLGAPLRATASDPGSLLIFPDIEVRWDAAGEVIDDTFIVIQNTSTEPVEIMLHLVNGDPPVDAAPPERAHPGYNSVCERMTLLGEQITYWSALTGMPGAGGTDPIMSLDPGSPPGRPDLDGGTGRRLRGTIYAWAISDDEEIRWNHLLGSATHVDYARGATWEYAGVAHRAVADVDEGAATGTPGALHLDGTEYAWGFDRLLLDFPAPSSTAWSGPRTVSTDVHVTLLPADADFRASGDGPVATQAVWEIWNENGVRFVGTRRCVTGWDRTLLSAYDPPNHFLLSVLQTDGGRARVDGRASSECDAVAGLGDDAATAGMDIISIDAALLGVSVTNLQVDTGSDFATTGTNLVGMGLQSATIRFDTTDPMELGVGCRGDLDHSGHVDFADVLEVLITWGPCPGVCPTDLDGNGTVGFDDVLVVIVAWGPCG